MKGYRWVVLGVIILASFVAYILRTNVRDWSAEELWRTYIQLTEAEAAFRIHKSDLSIRPIWHQKAERVQAHILVCFLAYVLWKTLEQWQQRAGLGNTPRTILEEIGVRTGRDTRLAIADVPAEHSLVWTEQMLPVLPVVRVPDVDRAIDLAIAAEQGCGHTASIFTRDVDAITSMAREINVSIFVANAANLAGLADGGEGFTSFSIASPTGDGLTRPRTFSRERRVTVVGALRIV